jgi:hypothetical protein
MLCVALCYFSQLVLCPARNAHHCRVFAWTRQRLLPAHAHQPDCGLTLSCAMLCCAAQTLPLLGGRNASAHAAAVIELLCSPPAAAAAPAAASSSSSAGKDGGKSGKASRAASAKSTSGSSAAAGGEAALASALQQGIVAAGGLQALLKVCNIDAAVSTDGMNLNAAALRSHRQEGMHENGGKHAPLTEAPQPRRVRHA